MTRMAMVGTTYRAQDDEDEDVVGGAAAAVHCGWQHTGQDGLGLFIPLFLFCSIFLPLSRQGNLFDIGKAVGPRRPPAPFRRSPG